MEHLGDDQERAIAHPLRPRRSRPSFLQTLETRVDELRPPIVLPETAEVISLREPATSEASSDETTSARR